MRNFTAALIVLTLTFILASAFTSPTSSAPRESCSCAAEDGSCSASGTCVRGCIATCPSNGCTVHCSGFTQFFETEATMRMQSVTRGQLVAEVARLSGKDISFSSTKPDVPFNLDVNRAPLWDVLEILADQGTVIIAGEDFEKLRATRRALLSGEKISICVHNTPVSTFVSDLSNLSGLPIRVRAGNPRTTVNVKLQEVALTDIIQKVSEQTGVEIINEDDESAGR